MACRWAWIGGLHFIHSPFNVCLDSSHWDWKFAEEAKHTDWKAPRGPICPVLTWSLSWWPWASCPLQVPGSSPEPGTQRLPSLAGEWMDRWTDCGGLPVTHALLASVQDSKVVGDTRLWLCF